MIGWIGLGISVLALVASGASVVYSRRSAGAAGSSAESAARSAAIAEREEQRRLEEADRTAVRWRLEPDALHQSAEGYAFRLTNDGTRPALRVFLKPPREAQQRGNVPDGQTINAGSAVEFELFPPAIDMSRTEMVISWQITQGGEEYTQRWVWADLL